MSHDSYQCQNEHLTGTSPRKSLSVPHPTQRHVGAGADGDLYPEKMSRGL